jgi:hypothetical protein
LSDFEAAVLVLFFFGDLSAIGHPSLGSTNGFGRSRLRPLGGGFTGCRLLLVELPVDALPGRAGIGGFPDSGPRPIV